MLTAQTRTFEESQATFEEIRKKDLQKIARNLEKKSTPVSFQPPPALHNVILDLAFEIMPKVCLFGGAVRDLLLGAEPHDLDFLTRLNPEEFKQVERYQYRLNKIKHVLSVFGYQVNEIVKKPHLDDQSYDFLSTSSEDHQFSWHSDRIGLIRWEVKRTFSNSSKEKTPEIFKVDWVSEIFVNGADFTCNLLTYDANKQLGVWITPNGVATSLSSHFLPMIGQIQADIQNRDLKLANPSYFLNDPVHAQTRPRNSEHRHEAIRIYSRAVKMMTRGWKLKDWKLEDLGFSFTLKRLGYNPTKSKTNDDLLTLEELEKLIVVECGLKSEDDDNQNFELSEEQCAICFDKFTDKTRSVIETDCNHLFHMDCLYFHMKEIGETHSQCPVCRKELENEIPEVN